MPSDALPRTEPKKPQDIEALKKLFKDKLDSILNSPLTVENIETFADVALNNTIKLTDEILKEYRTNKVFVPHEGQNVQTIQEQENEAFKVLDLPNISEVLESIYEVKEKIESIKEYVATNVEKTDAVITPPQGNFNHGIQNGNGKGLERKKLPRLVTLLYLIEHDFDIKPEETKITEGIVTPDMVRQTSYTRVEVSGLGRIIYICEEVGNASYVFDAGKLAELNISVEDLDSKTKEEKESLIKENPNLGARIEHKNSWRKNMSQALGGQFTSSEFTREIGNWLPFEDFQNEARSLYPGHGDIQKWYYQERKKHPNWHSLPSKFYKNKGWIGFPELVGMNNRFKKDYPFFSDFEDEVRSLYGGQKDVSGWYNQERKKHPNWHSAPDRYYQDTGWISWSQLVNKENPTRKQWSSFEDFQVEVLSSYGGQKDVSGWYNQERKKHPNWPSDPFRTYRDKGFLGLPELVGVDNRLKKDLPLFDDFQNEVRSLYPGYGDIQKWYHQERKKHPNWPSNPKDNYGSSGWVGFPELVGKENFLKKEYLPFETFRAEVRSLYLGDRSVKEWYHQERKKHPNWHSAPHKYYKDKGWIDWPELVGKENFFKKEFLSFEDFKTEVRTLYPGEMNVQKWYHQERKKHPNWPSDPFRFYKNKGWVNFPELVGKK